jgi:hypothetical protein
MISKVVPLQNGCTRSLLDDAHSLQLHMSAEKSGSAVVLPINTQKLVNSFKFFKNDEFSPKNAKSDKMFQI